MTLRLICVVLVSALAGCSATRGSAPTMNKMGAIQKINLSGPAKAFFDDEQAASKARTDAASAQAMARSGFALVRANCIDYFDDAGSGQQWLLFSRDVVAAVGTLATAAVALYGGHANSAGTIALITNASFSGMDIYAKNFLFAAENVSAVKELVLRALDTHHQAVAPSSILNYSDAANAIYDNQHYCSPMKISALAREAIQKGVVVPKLPSADVADANDAVDDSIYQKLGALLNPPGALGVNQTVALWWLLKEGSTPIERKDDIWPLLESIDPARRPIQQDGSANPGVDSTRIVELLNGFSGRTKASFRAQVEAAKARRPAPGVPAIPRDGMPAPIPPIGNFTRPSAERNPSPHVSVGIL